MIKNPVTSVIGILVALCPIIGAIFPEAKDLCDKITAELVGLGFIASADGVKKPQVSTQQLSSFFIGTLLVIGLTSCAQLKQATDLLNPFIGKVESSVAELAAGEYVVSVKKDGKELYQKTIVCTKNDTELTGCHEK